MKLLLLLFFGFFGLNSFSQYYFEQNFDGDDTSSANSLFIILEDSIDNIWQIGEPDKVYFDTASTMPNAIMTDTINAIPDSNYSAFIFGIGPELLSGGILAINWNQKLDFDSLSEGGFIEYSPDTGTTWKNIFESPETYNIYGYDASNEYFNTSGEQGFSGLDTTWKNIWFCIWVYDLPVMTDTLLVRFRIETDTIEHGSEGWMIDNLVAEETFFHTLAEQIKDKSFEVFPTLINTQSVHVRPSGLLEESSVHLFVYNTSGQIVHSVENYDFSYPLDLNHLSNGKYMMRIKSKNNSEIHNIVIQR